MTVSLPSRIHPDLRRSRAIDAYSTQIWIGENKFRRKIDRFELIIERVRKQRLSARAAEYVTKRSVGERVGGLVSASGTATNEIDEECVESV